MNEDPSTSEPSTAQSAAPAFAQWTWPQAQEVFKAEAAQIALAAVSNGRLEKTIVDLIGVAKAMHANEQQAFAAVAGVIVEHWVWPEAAAKFQSQGKVAR